MSVPPDKIDSAIYCLRQYAGLATWDDGSSQKPPWEVFHSNGQINPYQIINVLSAQSVLIIDMHDRIRRLTDPAP